MNPCIYAGTPFSTAWKPLHECRSRGAPGISNPHSGADCFEKNRTLSDEVSHALREQETVAWQLKRHRKVWIFNVSWAGRYPESICALPPKKKVIALP